MLEDAHAIAVVNAEAGKVGWAGFLPPDRLALLEAPVEGWETRLRHAEPSTVFVAIEEEEVVGFSSVAIGDDAGPGERVGELTTLYTHPEAWGRGVGRALMERALVALLEQGCHGAVLWTEERSRRARRVYEAAGWLVDGHVREREFLGCPIRELRYRTAIDACLERLRLGNPAA